MWCASRMGILILCILFLALTYQAKADLADIVEQCCTRGTEWAQIDTQCYDFPRPIQGIDEDKQTMCSNILEVCCLKSRQKSMCRNGKADALGPGRCVVRDDEVGAVTYKECCNCCNLGIATRTMGMECNAPGIGAPCDLKFMECCTGISDNPEPATKDGDGDGDIPTDVADIDECQMFGDARLCSQICVNTIGSFRCECNPGYTLADDGSTCYEAVAGCAQGHTCSQDCVDTSRGPTCVCRDGYRMETDRITCTDVDECRRGMDNCQYNERCVNTEGSFTCESALDEVCAEGFQLDELTGRCVPKPVQPSTDVDCQPGFAFNTVSNRCEDIDECIVQMDNCNTQSEVCQNTYGSFYCNCEDGFRRTSYNDKCEDIDECARRTDTCLASERCENTVGSFACRRLTPCGTGWTLDEETQNCVDQNECELGTHNCRIGYDCFNIEGSFRCNPKKCPVGSRFSSSTRQCETVDCPRGLTADGSSLCVDVNECDRPDACKPYQTCLNSYGSYRCQDPQECRPGYHLDASGQQCVDIDECANGTHDCDSTSTCINRMGSYTCSCPVGYRRLAGRCVDKDECQYGLCPFNSRCENTQGSYNCICNNGLEQQGNQCVDIDECNAQSRCEHRCVNRIGGFECTCNVGYRLASNNRNCVDIDECRQFGTRGRLCGGECINTPGSYRCTCPNGWKVLGNGRSCQDVNECTEGTDTCGSSPDVMCFNTRGSHKCPQIFCPPGFSRSSLGPRRNSVRCKRRSFTCRKGDTECLNAPLSLSYNFLTFPTNIKIPTDLFSMSGPQTAEKRFDWSLNVTGVFPQGASVRPAQRSDFDLRIGRNDAVVSLQNRLTGPQDIELSLKMQITDRFTGYTGYAYSNIYLYITSANVANDVVVEVDDILCVKDCEWYDSPCLHNETMSVSYQFMALPTISEVQQPTILLNITAQGFLLIPQMFLHIMSGNDDNTFDTQVNADIAFFRLLKPLEGPAVHQIMLRLENRDYIGNKLISAHNTHLTIDVSPYDF